MKFSVYIFLLLFIAPGLAHTQNTFSLDEDFGVEGQAIFPISPGNSDIAQDKSYQLGIQSDGKIILAGYSNDIGGTDDWIITVVRLHSNGTLDISFGKNGVARIDFGPEADEVYAIDIQQDDKIVLTGRVWNVGTTGVGIVRLLPDGMLDPSFGTDGKVLYHIGSVSEEGIDIKVLENSKILAVSRSWQQNGVTGWGIMRLLSDGSPDSTFNQNGKIYYNSGWSNDQPACVLSQNAGRLLIGGMAGQNPTIIRCLEDGSFDASFGEGGIANIETEGIITSIVVDSQGRIAYSAYKNDGIIKTGRLHSNGLIDKTFGVDGMTIIDTKQNSIYTSYDRILLLPDGNILGLGTFNDPSSNFQRLSLILFDKNGKILKSFLTHSGMQFHICDISILGLDAIFLKDGSIGITSGGCSMQRNFDMMAAKLVYDPETLTVATSDPLQNILVYPNPSSGAFRLESHLPMFGDVSVSIHNTEGREIYTRQFRNTDQVIEDIFFAQPGTYVAAITHSLGVDKVKIVILR